jgi:hypothetical protein
MVSITLLSPAIIKSAKDITNVWATLKHKANLLTTSVVGKEEVIQTEQEVKSPSKPKGNKKI